MHPLSPNLTQLSDTELHKKYNELVTKLTQSYRFGSTSIVGQLQLILNDYKTEIDQRNQKILDDLAKKSKNLSGIIDIQ
jgi:hypothetical protein